MFCWPKTLNLKNQQKMWSNAFQISLFYWGKRIKNEFKLYPIFKKKKANKQSGLEIYLV